jgi:radical SAM superfamily enzyme YgiQ (UPF0313 family)
MREEILRPLAESGARSVTIAPETGTDELRRRLNKPISNASILEAAETAFTCGIESLKMYFIIGLPGETDDDVKGIARLLRQVRELMVSHARPRGRLGNLLAGFNVLVPKPYTPYSREAMLTRKETRRRMQLVEKQLDLSRGDCSAYQVLETAASGCSLGELIAAHRHEIERSAHNPVEGDPIWQFVTSAPTRNQSAPETIERR